MSSILTNNGAMIALQTLKGINSNMAKTQSEISTGKSVANAKDNAAIWAISKTMESDVTGFKAISAGLGLGQSTVAVAQQAAETVTDLLTQMKEKITGAQGKNDADRSKTQTDIKALKDQITAVVSAAQFNGVNLLSNTSKTAGTGKIDVLSSLDRSDAGVTASNIKVKKQDLSSTAQEAITTTTATVGTYVSGAATAATPPTLTGGATAPTTTFTILDSKVKAGVGYSLVLTGSGGTLASIDTTTATGQVSEIQYVARDNDTAEDVFNALNSDLKKHLKSKGVDSSNLSMSFNSSTGAVTIKGATGTGNNVTVSALSYNINSGTSDTNTIGGGLSALSKVDVAKDATSAATSLDEIEGLIQTATDAAAAFGSAAGRLGTQAKFISALSDSLKAGIGTLVDADMEETSARLQALQVQQQLGVQSLSIANQAPQSILSLFRG